MSKIDLLVVFPCSQVVLDNLLLVNDYNSMQAYFINKELSQITDKNIICIGVDNLWIPKQKGIKNGITYEQLSNALKKHNVNLSNCINILFTHLGAHRQFHKSLLDKILNEISGSVYKFEDCNIRLFDNPRICTIGHFTDGNNVLNYFDAGLSVATNIFVPNQNYLDGVFKVHVDHNYVGVDNSFKEIKDLLLHLKSKIQKDSYWKTLEVYYHDSVCDINDLGHFNFNNLNILSLAKIYSQCHLSFISHRESLGQYPLEMLSSGAGVVLLNNKFLKRSIKEKLDNVLITDISKISLNISSLKEQSVINQQRVLRFSYKNFVNEILNVIFNIKD